MDAHRRQRQVHPCKVAPRASPERLPGSERQRRQQQHPQRASLDPPGGGDQPEPREPTRPRHHYQPRRLPSQSLSKPAKSKPRPPAELARVASFVRDVRGELSPPPGEGLGFHSSSFHDTPSFQLPLRHHNQQRCQSGAGDPPSIASLNASYAEDLSRIGTAMSLPPSTVMLAMEASAVANMPCRPFLAGDAHGGDHANCGSAYSPRSETTTLPPITPRKVLISGPISGPVSTQLASAPLHAGQLDVRLLLASQDLVKYGMPSTMIERVYRLVEFFCAGFHNLCAELVKSSDQPAPLLSKIWTVFARQAEHVFRVQYSSDLAHLLEELDQQQLAMTEALAQAISETRDCNAAHHLMEAALKEARESIASLQTKHDALEQQAAVLREKVARGESNLKEEALLRHKTEKELESMADLNSKCAWQTCQIWELHTQLETMQRNQDVKDSEIQGLQQSLAQKEEQLGAATAERQKLLEKLQATQASLKQSAKAQMEATAKFDERLENMVQERVQVELRNAPIGPANEIADLKQENECQREQLRSLMQLLHPEDTDNRNHPGIQDMDAEDVESFEEQEAIKLKSGLGTLDPNRAFEMHNLQVNLAIVKGRNKKMSAQLTEARIRFNAKLAELEESLALQTSNLDAARKRSAILETNCDRLEQDNAELKAAACQGEAAMQSLHQKQALEQESVLAATRNETAKYRSQLESCQSELSNLRVQHESLDKKHASDNQVSKMVLAFFSETVQDQAKEKVQAALRHQETVSLFQHVQVMWTTLRSQLQAQLQAAMDKGASLEQEFAQVAIQDAEANHRTLTKHLTMHVHALHRGLKNSMEAHRQIEKLVNSLLSLEQSETQEPAHSTGPEQVHAEVAISTSPAGATMQPAPPITSPKSSVPAPARGRSLTRLSASSKAPAALPVFPEQNQQGTQEIKDEEEDAAATLEPEGGIPCAEEKGKEQQLTVMSLDPHTRARLAELEARVAQLAVRWCATEKMWLAAVLESGGVALPGEVEQGQDDTGASFAAGTRWQSAGAGLGATTKDVKLREEALVHYTEEFAQRHLLSLARRALNIQCQVQQIVRARRLADRSTRNPEQLDEEAHSRMGTNEQQMLEQEADLSLDNDPNWTQWLQDYSDAERMQALETDIANIQIEYFASAWNSAAADAARVKIQRVNTMVDATVRTMLKSLARDVKLFRLTEVGDSLERLQQDLTHNLSTEQPQIRKLRHAINQVLQDKINKDQTNIKEELAKVQLERLRQAEGTRDAHAAARLPLKMAQEALAHSEAHYQAVRARAYAESALLRGCSLDPNIDSLNRWVASARAQVMARRAACVAEHARSVHRMGTLHIWQAEQDLVILNLVQAGLVAAYNKDVGLIFRLEHKEVISRAHNLRDKLQSAVDGMIALEADQATNAAMLLAEYARLQSLACAALPMGPQHSRNTLLIIPAHRRWEGIMLDQGVVVAQTEMVKAISALAQANAEAYALNHMQRLAHAKLVALAPKDESVDGIRPNSKDGKGIDPESQHQINETCMQRQQAAAAVVEAVHNAYKHAQQRVREMIAVVHESERRLVAAIHVAAQSTVVNIRADIDDINTAKVRENANRIFHASNEVNLDDKYNMPIQAQELALLEAEGASLSEQQSIDTCRDGQPGLMTSNCTSSSNNQGCSAQSAAAVGSSGPSTPDTSVSKIHQSTSQLSSQADKLEPSQRLLVDFVMRRLDIISSGEDLASVGGVPGDVLNPQSQEEIVLELMQCLPITENSQLVLIKALTALGRQQMVTTQPLSSIKDADTSEPTHQAGSPDSSSDCKLISALAQMDTTGKVIDNKHGVSIANISLHRKQECIIRLQNTLQAVLRAQSTIQEAQVLFNTDTSHTAQSGEQTNVDHCEPHAGVLAEGVHDGEHKRSTDGGDASVQCADSPILAGIFGAAFAKLRSAYRMKVMLQQQRQSQNDEQEQQPPSPPSWPHESQSKTPSRSDSAASSIDLDSAPSCHSPPVAPASCIETDAFGQRFSLPVYVGVNAYVQDAGTSFEDVKTLSGSMADQTGSSEFAERMHIQGASGKLISADTGPVSSLRAKSKPHGRGVDHGLGQVQRRGTCNNRTSSHIQNGNDEISRHVGSRDSRQSPGHATEKPGIDDSIPEEETFIDMVPVLPKYRCFRDGLYILELPEELGVWKLSKNMRLLGLSGLDIHKGKDFPGFLIPPVKAEEVIKVAQQFPSCSNVLSGIHPPAGFVKQQCSGPWWAAQGAWAHRTGTLDWLAATQPLGLNSPRALRGLAEQIHPAVHVLDQEVLDENMEFEKTDRLPPGLDSQVWGATQIDKLMKRVGTSRPSG